MDSPPPKPYLHSTPRVFFAEFRRCARAILAFAAGYKAGEGYRLGQIEASRARRLDAEAWGLGCALATRRRSVDPQPPTA